MFQGKQALQGLVYKKHLLMVAIRIKKRFESGSGG
jgi:hypothetical protein